LINQFFCRLLSTKDDCQYLFKWNTAAACEGLTIEEEDKGTSGGLIAFIVIISLMATYLIVGVLYNRFVKGEKGVHQIPHFAFCQAGYEMAEDCFVLFYFLFLFYLYLYSSDFLSLF